MLRPDFIKLLNKSGLNRNAKTSTSVPTAAKQINTTDRLDDSNQKNKNNKQSFTSPIYCPMLDLFKGGSLPISRGSKHLTEDAVVRRKLANQSHDISTILFSETVEL